MANLQQILYQVPLLQTMGTIDREIRQLRIDSRLVEPGDLFIAVRGSQADGHNYIAAAIAAGAVAIVCEEFPPITPDGISFIQVKQAGEALGWMAHHFYGNPSGKITLVGVTGTNGKTTIATLLFRLFTSLGYHCGLISTVQNQIGNTVLPSTHTTPDAIHLNELLSKMQQAGCTHVFMECSSHAIHQNRITGLQFAGAVFSNITHDHLDYHKTFDEYIRVKKSFFDHLPNTAFALTNADDKRGMVMLQNTKAVRRTYSLHQPADYKGRILENRRGNESIITVVGCGGDRDKTKRPVMAKIAVQYSNKVILTSDNPRTEDPTEILQDMQRGLEAADARKYLTVSDRKEAIKTAVSIANAGDIILVAGKGHEKYQEIKGVKHPFDDKQVLVETFQLLNK